MQNAYEKKRSNHKCAPTFSIYHLIFVCGTSVIENNCTKAYIDVVENWEKERGDDVLGYEDIINYLQNDLVSENR